ncbi:Uncharacterised protein [Yersinia frederiksenii]|nr:Uncharacterised protein [Yersinia frederiksenii]
MSDIQTVLARRAYGPRIIAILALVYLRALLLHGGKLISRHDSALL